MTNVKKKARRASQTAPKSATRSNSKHDSVSAVLKRTHSGYALRDDVVEEALISGEYRDLLETYFGEEVYEDLRSLATRARTERTRGGPRVLVLPGIMGSKLGLAGRIFDDTIWVDPIEVIAGNLKLLSLDGGVAEIVPLGVLLTSYLKLKLRLKLAGFDADFHPYDWRQSIPDLGRQLAERIQHETGKDNQQEDVYIVAHSMGGLVSRAAYQYLLNNNESNRVRRLIMLGTPNFGSFSSVQALSGSHALVKKVAALDLANSHEELVNQVFNTFPGLYQMLPSPVKFAGVDLFNPDNWPPTGIGPRAEMLVDVSKVHDVLAPGQDRFTLVAGINQDTVVSMRREGNEFVYSLSLEGDGTVPLAFAQLEGVTTYFVEESHGSLPNNREVSRAVIELLETGQTQALPTSWTPSQRGVRRELHAEELAPVPFDGRTGNNISQREIRYLLEEFATPAKRVREDSPVPVAAPLTAVSGEPIIVGRQRQQRINLQLAHGSITQVDTRAVVLGLFRGVTPAGAARAIDQQLDGVISEFTDRRMISANVGEVFVMPANRYRMGADMVVFVGLGTYDDFNDEVLRLAAGNLARALVRTKVDDFATVMLSAGSGMAMADVLTNLMEGFLRGLNESDRQGRLRSITLCEMDRGRFEQMQQEILRLTTTNLFDDVEVTVEFQQLPPVPIQAPSVSLRGMYVGKEPTYLIVREMPDLRAEETDPELSASFMLRASVLTAGVKATVVTDTLQVDVGALHNHLEFIETNDFVADRLPEFGKELGRMVLPPLVRKAVYAMREHPLVVLHDARTARIPWETVSIDDWFLAGAEGLSRKYEAEDLSIAKWLEERRLAEELSVLLIINPTRDLPGAEAEGTRIKTLLEGVPAVHIDELRGDEATWSAVRAAFRSGRYDVVHYAGHAFFDPYNRARSGIICYGNKVLSGRDLAYLEKLPALVFFNACEAGRVRSVRERRAGSATAKRLETNVSLAEAFLRAGVGNYLGTYWPVEDAPAKSFAETFYQFLIGGEAVGSALKAGRARLQEPDLASVDWADYIHYGSPGFVVKRRL